MTAHDTVQHSIGVVIPAYNAETFLAAAIESVLAQTHSPVHIVVVDDGSSDRTSAIARAFEPQVSCILQENSGVATARNRGVATLTTQWLAFLDADDLWRAEKLERQLRVARESAVDVVLCGIDTIDAKGRRLPPPRKTTTSLDIEPLLLHSAAIPQATSSTILVRRAAFEAVGGYDSCLSTMADWDLLIRLRLRGQFGYVDEALALYRRYGNTMSQNLPMLERESRLVLQKTFASGQLAPELLRLRRRAVAWNDLVLSGSHWHGGSAGKSLTLGLRALAQDPRLVWRALGFPLRSVRRWF
jgi:glycosyltransferase involved in cell wall biosynthesis